MKIVLAWIALLIAKPSFYSCQENQNGKLVAYYGNFSSPMPVMSNDSWLCRKIVGLRHGLNAAFVTIWMVDTDDRYLWLHSGHEYLPEKNFTHLGSTHKCPIPPGDHSVKTEKRKGRTDRQFCEDLMKIMNITNITNIKDDFYVKEIFMFQMRNTSKNSNEFNSILGPCLKRAPKDASELKTDCAFTCNALNKTRKIFENDQMADCCKEFRRMQETEAEQAKRDLYRSSVHVASVAGRMTEDGKPDDHDTALDSTTKNPNIRDDISPVQHVRKPPGQHTFAMVPNPSVNNATGKEGNLTTCQQEVKNAKKELEKLKLAFSKTKKKSSRWAYFFIGFFTSLVVFLGIFLIWFISCRERKDSNTNLLSEPKTENISGEYSANSLKTASVVLDYSQRGKSTKVASSADPYPEYIEPKTTKNIDGKKTVTILKKKMKKDFSSNTASPTDHTTKTVTAKSVGPSIAIH